MTRRSYGNCSATSSCPASGYQGNNMTEMPEHEERSIRDYVNSQSPDDDHAELVQKISTYRILGRVHETYDVHTKSARWWVITNPTNLYRQTDFPKAEQALIFHLGLGIYITERSPYRSRRFALSHSCPFPDPSSPSSSQTPPHKLDHTVSVLISHLELYYRIHLAHRSSLLYRA